MRTMPNVDLRSMRRVRYVTNHYPQIQGLRLLPLGVWLLSMTAYEYFTKPNGFVAGQEPGWLFALLYFGGPVIVLVLYGFIRTFFYEHAFGTVQARQQRSRGLSGCLSSMLAAVLLLQLSSSMEILQSTGGFGFALMLVLLLAWWDSDWYRKDYAIMCALVAVITLAPVIYRDPASSEYRAFAMTTYSLVIIAGAILDHLLLIRTFKPVED